MDFVQEDAFIRLRAKDEDGNEADVVKDVLLKRRGIPTQPESRLRNI